MKKTQLMTLLVVVMALAVSPMIAMAGTKDEGTGYETEFTSGWLGLPPTVDGDIDINEYANATVVEIDYEVADDVNFTDETIYLYFGNDANWLYMAFDICYMNYTDDTMGIEMAFDEDNDDEFEYDFDDGNEQWVYLWTESEGFPFSEGGDDQLKVKDEPGTFGAVGDPPVTLVFDAESFNASMFSNKPILYAVGFDETVNCDTDHVIMEFAIPLSNMKNGEMELGDIFRFGVFGGLDSGDEEWSYPIDVEISEEDSSDWAEITLATTVVVTAGYSAVDYALMMIGIGFIILLIMTLGFKDWVMEQIAEDKHKMIIVIYAISTLLVGLGLLQAVYDWLGALGFG